MAATTVTPAPSTQTEDPTPIRREPGRWINHWDPEDEAFWEGGGRRSRGATWCFSILAEHLGFSVWVLWSIVAVNLPRPASPSPSGQLFWLVAVPNLVGATLRLPYTFAVPRFGGRNWTIVSALLLVIPAPRWPGRSATPDTPFWVMLLVAATAGFGGGNFASSMTNILLLPRA